MDPKNTLEYENKLKKVFQLLLESKTRVQNDCYLEKLLTKIEETGNAFNNKLKAIRLQSKNLAMNGLTILCGLVTNWFFIANK